MKVHGARLQRIGYRSDDQLVRMPSRGVSRFLSTFLGAIHISAEVQPCGSLDTCFLLRCRLWNEWIDFDSIPPVVLADRAWTIGGPGS